MTDARVKAPLTEGNLFVKILFFVIPIVLTGIFQLLYNTADQVVVGQFSGDPNALAAVGSTTSVYNLITNLITGLSAGAVVVISQSFGAGREEDISRSVHTVITISFIVGIVLSLIGLLVSRPLLSVMGTKEEVFESAHSYLTIIILGIPASSVYNFAATIFRAKGDSKTPFIVLTLSGIVNVALNLVLVIVFRMGVAGVAVATIVSQAISAVILIVMLLRTKEAYRLYIKRLCIDFSMLKRILLVGIPSAIQGSLFSISNLLVQSSINTFPTADINGNTVSITLEGYVHIAVSSYNQAILAAVGQNLGAGRFDRVKKTLLYTMIQLTVVAVSISAIELVFAREIASLFIDMTSANAEAVIEATVRRMFVILPTYFLCGWMECLSGYQRGLGYSLIPMINTVFCVCVIRVIWVLLVFPLPSFNTPFGLYIIYPISYVLCCFLSAITSVFATRRAKKSLVK